MGAVSHIERWKQYLTEIYSNVSPSKAALKYSNGVLKDSHEWGIKGLYYFYDKLSHEDAVKAYDEALRLYNKGKVETPDNALKMLLMEGRKSTVIKDIKFKCPEIRNVLDAI